MNMTEYPHLNFSTGLDVNGMDMAEWVSHAYFDLHTAKLALDLWGWEEQAAEARRICHDLLDLLEAMKKRTTAEE